MNVEIWKDIANFSKYQVSNLGRIKSKGRYTKVGIKNQDKCYRKEYIVDGFINKKGYKQVTLYDDNGKPKTMRVHKLVALAFIENKDNLPQINHKDGNKQNNCVDNLEWCTHQENVLHAFHNGLNKKDKRNTYKRKYELASRYIKKYQRKDGFLNLNEWQTEELLEILEANNENR